MLIDPFIYRKAPFYAIFIKKKLVRLHQRVNMVNPNSSQTKLTENMFLKTLKN